MAAPADSVNEMDRPAPRAWRWLMPSMTQWLWLVVLIILLAQPWRMTMVSSDGDACMHWRVGEWMLEHKQIIRTDVFSHTRFGAPIVSKEWLSEIVFAVAGRFAGLYGVAVVGALVIATSFALLHRQLLQDENDSLVAVGVTLLAACAACAHWLARPHAFSFLMAVLWHEALRRFEATGNARTLAVKLCPLTVLWVNLHGGYLAGILVLMAYWLGAVIQQNWRKVSALSAAGLLCGVVSLVNPNGYQLHVHNIHFLQSDFFKNWLAEYKSMNFDSPEAIGFLLWLALLFLTLALYRPKLSVPSSLVLISWTYFALYAGRNIPLMAIFTAPIIAPALSETVRKQARALSERLSQINDGRGWPVVAAAAIVAIAFVSRPVNLPADRWPVAAVEFIDQHPDQFAGNMFNQYIWGGYLMQVLPGHKVFVDGRTDFYGETLIRQFDNTTSLSTNWMEALVQYNVSWTLMPTAHRLNLALALLPNWTCVYSNEVATIFRKAE